MADLRSRPWLFVGGIILASIAVLGLTGIVFRMCRKHVLKDRLPFMIRGRKKYRSGKVSGSRPTVEAVDPSSPRHAEQQQGSFMAWKAGDVPTNKRPPSPPRLLAFACKEDRFGVGDGGSTIADADAASGEESQEDLALSKRERGGVRAARLGAWAARFRPATIHEEEQGASDPLGAAMETGPVGPGGCHMLGGVFGSGSGSGSAENLDAPEGQGPTSQSDAMLPQMMAPSDESLPGIATSRGAAWSSSKLVNNLGTAGHTGSTGATMLGPVDSSATLS